MLSSNFAAAALILVSSILGSFARDNVGRKQVLRGLGRAGRQRGHKNYEGTKGSKNKSGGKKSNKSNNKSGNSSNKGKGSNKSKNSDKKRGGDNLICYINEDLDSIEDVEGLVTISYNNEYEFFMQLQVFGLEENLDANVAADAAKVYIDEGTSCNDLKRPLYEDAEDPWSDANYSTDDDYSDSAFRLNNGLDASENAGHAVVIEDTDGDVAGCCVLKHTDHILKAEIEPLSGSDDTPTGSIFVHFRPDDTFEVSYYLEGVTEDCSDGLIKFMDGYTCDEFGDTYYDTIDDPWAVEMGATYESDKYGFADGDFNLYNGYSFIENLQVAVVVFDAKDDTKVIGCGILKIENDD